MAFFFYTIAYPFSIHIDLGFSAPYLDLPLLRSGIPSKSLTPRIQWDFTPGESFTLPPLIKTIECSCKLWPSPGMWANISCRLLNRTLTILRRAELGFLGVLVETRRHTPCFWGHWSKARVRSVRRFSSLPWRINWFNVGIALDLVLSPYALSLVITPNPKHPFFHLGGKYSTIRGLRRLSTRVPIIRRRSGAPLPPTPDIFQTVRVRDFLLTSHCSSPRLDPRPIWRIMEIFPLF